MKRMNPAAVANKEWTHKTNDGLGTRFSRLYETSGYIKLALKLLFVCVCVFSGHGAVDDMLDAENKRMAENLVTKVSRLKSVSHV